MKSSKQRIKNTLLNRCKCCLRERPSEDMWDEHLYHNETENYGIMLSSCFQLPWHEPLSGMERICYLCIGRLRDAVSFKSQILDAQKFKSELLDDALRLDDITDIEQKIHEFLEKHLNITVAFEPVRKPIIDKNRFFKIKSESNIIEESNVVEESNADQESTYEFIENDTDRPNKDQEDKNVDVEANAIDIEYLDEEYLDMETNVGNKDIPVESVSQVTNDGHGQAVVIVGNTIIKKRNKVTKNTSKLSEPDQDPDIVIETAVTTETVQDPQTEYEITEQTDVSYSSEQEDNSDSDSSNEYEDKVDSSQGVIDTKSFSKEEEKGLLSTNESRRNYLIERTKHQVNLVALLLTTNATPIYGKTDNGYQCGFCYSYFQDPRDLRTHTHEKHGKSEKATYMAEEPLGSLVVKLDITDLHCTKCGVSLEDIDTTWDHLKSHGIKIHTDIKSHFAPFKFHKNQLKCIVCHEVILFRGLLRHMNKHSKNFLCGRCGEGFICKRLMDRHNRYHHDDGEFSCQHCAKQFTNRVKWLYHIKFVHETKKEGPINRIRCGICNERFSSEKKKIDHLQSAHNVHTIPRPKSVGKKEQCEICNKMFRNKRNMKEHVLNVHQRLKQYQCAHCDKEFFYMNSLKRHLNRHAKYVECSICSKYLRSQKQLKLHMRVHKNNLKYKCTLCSEAFVTIAGRQAHMRYIHKDTFLAVDQDDLSVQVERLPDIEELS